MKLMCYITIETHTRITSYNVCYTKLLHRPWELYLQENKAGAEAKQLTQSTTKEFEKYNWRIPEYITFNAEDGAEVHARLYRPESPEKQGPAVIFVHGAGYLQNAHKS